MHLIVNPRPLPVTELKAARHLLPGDRLRLGNDPQAWRLLSLHVDGERPDARCRLVARGEDDGARVLLVRAGQDLLQVQTAPAAAATRACDAMGPGEGPPA